MKIFYNMQHLRAHEGDFIVPEGMSFSDFVAQLVERLESEIAKTVPPEERVGRFEGVFFPDESFGLTGVTPTKASDEVFWGYRPGRFTPSRFVRGYERHPNHGVVLFGRWGKQGDLILFTLFPGANLAPREPGDSKLWSTRISSSERKEALAFWAKHAFIAEGEIEPCSLSEELEQALQKGDEKGLRPLIDKSRKTKE